MDRAGRGVNSFLLRKINGSPFCDSVERCVRHELDGSILMVALCIPRNSELVPTAFVGLDSLLASSTSIIQAFPTSYLYRVSPSISSFSRLDWKSNRFSDLWIPYPVYLVGEGNWSGWSCLVASDVLLGRGEGESGDSMPRGSEREENAWTSDWRYEIELTSAAKQNQ
jgi:hypothetical protein